MIKFIGIFLLVFSFFNSALAQEGTAPTVPEPAASSVAQPAPRPVPVPAPTPPPPAQTQAQSQILEIPEPVPEEQPTNYLPVLLGVFAAGLGTAILWRLNQKKKSKGKENDAKCLNWQKLMEEKLNELTDIKSKLGDFAKDKTLEELKRETQGTRTGELLARAERAEKEYKRFKELYEKCIAGLLGEKEKSALRWIVGILNRHNVPFQISGGLAAKLYGSPRPLNDIDIDIPREKFEEIISDVKEYITLEPKDYKDEKWDLYLMTLNYAGQEIDIGSADIRIYDEKSNRWIPFSSRFDKSVWKEIEDLKIPIISKDDLIAVKKHLSGEHQKIDIAALL